MIGKRLGPYEITDLIFPSALARAMIGTDLSDLPCQW
jgi:hypothetical protein